MILRGDGTWPFQVLFVGSFHVLNVISTWFGGRDDPEDNGETASGVSTKLHPNLLGCALPMDFGQLSLSTRGSPIPRLPWGVHSDGKDNRDGAHVFVQGPKSSIVLPVIDNGPAKSASSKLLPYKRSIAYSARAVLAAQSKLPHAIDLTQAAFTKLGGDLKKGLLQVSYQVLG